MIVPILLGGCGGSNGGGTESASSTADHPLPRAYAAKAEAICRQSVKETRALGRRLSQVFSSAANGQEAITKGIVTPGIQILSKEASRLRSLPGSPNSPAFETFRGIFEPILELARQRLSAGSEGNVERDHQLELLIEGLGNEQSKIARSIGLPACAVGFTKALGGTG